MAMVPAGALTYGQSVKRFAAALGLVGLAGCAAPTSRAFVNVSRAAETSPLNAVLALPTVCAAQDVDASRCSPASYVKNRDGSPGRPMPATFAAFIDPLLRMKLELAGLTLADAETLRLETAERREETTTNERGRAVTTKETVQLSEAPTLLDLSPQQQRAAAGSLGLQGIASTTLRIAPGSSGRLSFQLTLELRALDDRSLLRARCAEAYESPDATATILANCVGDGVLAARAPDALIGRQP